MCVLCSPEKMCFVYDSKELVCGLVAAKTGACGNYAACPSTWACEDIVQNTCRTSEAYSLTQLTLLAMQMMFYVFPCINW